MTEPKHALGVQTPDDIAELLRRYERAAQRFGELWERCQGKGWPDAESDEFTRIRDERLPAFRAQITSAIAGVDSTRGGEPYIDPEGGLYVASPNRGVTTSDGKTKTPGGARD
jgi:hypothetical protein